MTFDIKKKLRTKRSRTYLNKDFDGFRSDLSRYTKTFFPDRIKDFSEASLGGLLLDLAAYVGDVNSFYLDHQFNELNVESAVETKNIERLIRAAGVKIEGAPPAVVLIKVAIEVPAELSSGNYQPQSSALPKILQGSVSRSNSGVLFEILSDIDFGEQDETTGLLTSDVIIASTDSSGVPTSYVLVRTVLAVSGSTATQTFRIPDSLVRFRKLTLSQENVTQIISVKDSDNNEYYEVEALTQDTVFRGITNLDEDGELVKENLEVVPAPYRYVKSTSLQTGLTTVQFGGGRADSLDDDIIPDPSDLGVPLYGKNNFSRFAIDPNSLLRTQTLGIAPVNTTLTIQYRHGGGLSHNVAAGTIRTLDKLIISFPGMPSSTVASQVRASIDIRNDSVARGGDDALTLDELRSKIPAARNAQSRIVTREDLLARVYTMPSGFGRVFRAGVRSNPNNPLSTQLFITSRDRQKKLVTSPDTLKKNLRTYLNQFRLISDAIDILDAQVINTKVTFQVAVEPNTNKRLAVQNVISDLKEYFNIKNFQIDQPISTADITNIIINTPGVLSIINLKITGISGNVLERAYSNSAFNVSSNTFKGLIIGPPGSIFEVRYPDFDIIGSAV